MSYILRVARSVFVAMVVGCGLSSGQFVLAQDSNSIAVGGSGGVAFSVRCSPGDYLVGLSGRSGNWVDAIAPVCAKWNPDTGAFGPPRAGDRRGGPGGQPKTFQCDDRSGIVSLFTEVAQNDYHSVGLLAPRCANATSPDKQTRPAQGNRFGTSFTERQPSDPDIGSSAVPYYDVSSMPRCGKNEIAVGIFGGAGNVVDRIGLICSSKPLVKASPVIRESGGNERPALLDRCKAGFYSRLARPDDTVCVTFQSRAQTAYENAHAAERVDPNGSYGPKSCVSGYVWRGAFDGDLVCVTPERRAAVKRENDLAESRRR